MTHLTSHKEDIIEQVEGPRNWNPYKKNVLTGLEEILMPFEAKMYLPTFEYFKIYKSYTP